MSEYVADNQKPSQVIHDYGTPNLLYISYVPLMSNLDKKNLESIKADVEAWFAFETGKAEGQVHDRLREKELPADSAVASRVQRTMYRAKVVEFFREDGYAWASRNTVDNSKKPLGPTPEDDAYGEVYEELKSHYITNGSLPEEFSFVLKSAILLMASTKSPNHRYLSTNVEYNYDAARETFTPVIKVAHFSVNLHIDETNSKKVTSTISYFDYHMNFNKETWGETKSTAKDFIASGEKIRKEMSLVLLVNTASSSTYSQQAIKG